MKEIMQEDSKTTTASGISRRKFFAFAGGLAGATVLLDACKKNDDDNTATPGDGTIDLGSGDHGLLNYAYMLEQLEADFYIKVLAAPYTGMTDQEKLMLEDIRAHEIAHREFLKNLLTTNAIPSLEFDFSGVDFTKRDRVLESARVFEDIGVMAYNGVSTLFVTPDNLAYALKMISVEGRHAAAIRELIKPGTFSDTTDGYGLDAGKQPIEIMPLITPVLKSKVSINNLPKS